MENIQDWYAAFLEDKRTSAKELDDFAKVAETNADFTELLATDYLEMGTMLAEHRNTSSETLSYLLEVISVDWKKADYVMQAIASNPNCPADALATLFLHGDRSVRETVVQHPAATSDIYLHAATDKRESVRLRLTYDNPNVPDAVLQHLATNDAEEHIRDSASETLRDRKKEADR